ncbi:MAG: hypothetical protein WDW38_003403 [Sanguina aurantia]
MCGALSAVWLAAPLQRGQQLQPPTLLNMPLLKRLEEAFLSGSKQHRQSSKQPQLTCFQKAGKRRKIPRYCTEPRSSNGVHAHGVSTHEPAREGMVELEADRQSLERELLTVAALEVAVSLAHPNAPQGGRARGAHAPARRLARTMMCMGKEQGAPFGCTALRMMERQLSATVSDLPGLAFWWSNIIHMRAILQGLSLGTSLAGSDDQSSRRPDHWAAAAFVPQLGHLERSAFNELLTLLWESVLMPAVVGGSKAAAGVKAATTKRATQEAAIKKWFEGLDHVSHWLETTGSAGHSQLLCVQVLLQLLRKLDAMMFYHLLLKGPSDINILSDYDPTHTLWGGPGKAVPQLDDSALPFSRGLLTFGGGMSVKMTVTRLQQWAAGEAILQEASLAGLIGDAGSGSSLFPLLRAAADLLMMPKELLMDKAIRLDVCCVLSMSSVLHILERFQQDEFATDVIDRGILQSLREENSQESAREMSHVRGAYSSPSDADILHKMELGDEPGLEYDDDSQDELEDVSSLSDGTAVRFKLLHELWASGVPRMREVSIANA